MTEALSHNDVLQTLVLDTNSIGDEGAEVLAKHLTSERTSLTASRMLCISMFVPSWLHLEAIDEFFQLLMHSFSYALHQLVCI